jgi:hypothetical protein
VKHSPIFNQALAIDLSATLANATEEGLVAIGQINAMVIRSREMVYESRELLARIEQMTSRRAAQPARQTNPDAQKARSIALAKAAECERQAREATSDEIRLTMWETRQFWTHLAHSCRDDVNDTL